MSKNEALIDCPHCGGPSEIKKFTGVFVHGWVGCPACKIYKNWNHDPADAIKKWNMRVSRDVA